MAHAEGQPEILRLLASSYWELGLNIVLLKDKKPLHEWEKWESQRQSEQDFNALPWMSANQYAIVCGTQGKNGLYFAAIDFDVKNLSIEIIEKGKQALKLLPITQTEETPSGGQHLVYYSHAKPATISAYHDLCGLELLGEKKLCIMAPSIKYTRLNDNTPTEVQDLEGLFLNALYRAGVEPKKQSRTWFDREDLHERPFKDENPRCIRELLLGVSEGQRNEVAIRLTSYLVNFRQVEPRKALRELQSWNRLNSPSLLPKELEAIFGSAVRGRYVFGCNDSILQSFCSADAPCSLRKKQEQKEPGKTYDAETEERINAEVQRILDAENQLEALKPHLDHMIEGEDNTKRALTVLLLSAKMPDAESKQIVLLKATEGAGKSQLSWNVTQGYRVKDVGRFSAHALDYSNLAEFEVLSLKELGSMDEEKQGVSTIKFLSSDDRGYSVEITTKDEATGRFTTEQYKIPAITVISSTTRLILDPQFERRAWLFSFDETPEQTKRIGVWKAERRRQRDDKLLGLRQITDSEFSTAVYRRFIQKFEPGKIVIPFPQQIVDVLGSETLRVRGDIDKLLTFVELYGLLNLKRLVKARDDVYVLTPEVAIEALKIAVEPLSGMLSRIDKRSRQVLDCLKQIEGVKIGENEAENKVEYDVKGAEIGLEERKQIATKIGKAEKTVRAFFSQLESAGYVSGDNRKPKTFTLLYDVAEIEKKLSGILAKPESSDDLIVEMRKETQEWLRTRSANLPLVDGHKILGMDRGSEEKEEPSAQKRLANPSLACFQTALAETSPSNRLIPKSPTGEGDSL